MAKPTKRHRDTWSDNDLTRLAKMAATESAEFVAGTLQRTVAAVRKKAGEVGASFGAKKRAPAKAAVTKPGKKPARRAAPKAPPKGTKRRVKGR